mmetsp:Transcript_39269/g.63919  ORF Transcript_39269/g.63919 Transcript_39269/m.63919 type:complete len:100 (-) Transcript_39269:418-717(-)
MLGLGIIIDARRGAVIDVSGNTDAGVSRFAIIHDPGHVYKSGFNENIYSCDYRVISKKGKKSWRGNICSTAHHHRKMTPLVVTSHGNHVGCPHFSVLSQ